MIPSRVEPGPPLPGAPAAIQPTPIIRPRRDGSGGGRRSRPRGPPRPAVVRRLAGAHVLRDADVLARPEGEAAIQRPRLCPSEAAPDGSVVLWKRVSSESVTGAVGGTL